MSFNENYKRCSIQKLDFENCIVSNIKTTARGRKKLRARITRDIEQISDTLKEKQQCEKPSSISRTSQPSSPVLIKNQRRKSESPVYSKKKKKINLVEKNMGNHLKNSTFNESSSPPGSPVFKTFKKHKTENDYLNSSQELHEAFGSIAGLDMFYSQDSSKSLLPGSFQIDEFTQESKPSIKISSVESSSMKNESCNILSVESKSVLSNVSQYSSLEMTNRFDSQENCESPKPVKKSYNKNSLLGRLHKLQQKQASEKLLWQHQNRKNSSGSLQVSVISFWKEDFNYFLKCQSVLSDIELTFLIVDSRWVPNVKKITEGSVVQLHPPWQKLSVEGSIMKVFLNVICLDVLNEIEEPILPKKKSELIPVIQFETNQKLFVDSLFSCHSGFF